MISITCTNCQTLLSIDDAFAGGVCRCQHCGTIQTVPAQRKSRPTTPGMGGTVAAPPPAPTPPQPRMAPQAAPPPPQKREAPPPPPAPEPEPVVAQAPEPGDLQNLAQAVAVSSGLRSGRLQRSDGYASGD